MENKEDIVDRTLQSLDRLQWVDPSADFYDRVMERIQAVDGGRVSWRFVWQMAAAVAVMVAINAWVWTSTQSPNISAPDQATEFGQAFGISEQL